MRKIEEYKLTFYVQKPEGFSERAICETSSNSQLNIHLASLISRMDEFEAEDMGIEVTNAINSQSYERHLISDGYEHIKVEIIPPNILIDGYQVPLSDMKEILEDWVSFVNENL